MTALRSCRYEADWQVMAEKRLIALQIPDVRQEIPSGVGKGRLLTPSSRSRL
jgi:hypothetical protein